MKNNKLTPIEQNGQRVLTTSQLAESFGTDADYINRNFNNNKDRYSEGKHFFLLEGEELRDYKSTIGKNDGSLLRVNKLYLWTEKGSWMHAKSLNTDQAWEAYELLVDDYYVKKELSAGVQPSYMLEDPIKRAERWIDEQKERKLIEDKNLMLEQRVAEYEPKISYIDRILESKKTLAITQIAADYDMTPQALNKLLYEERVQRKVNKQWLLYSEHLGKGFTKSETINITRSNGEPDTTLNTRWTQKGRLFIHEILKGRGIVPYMDRQQNTI